MSQMNPKNFSTTLHSQFNYHTLPVNPFKGIQGKFEFILLHGTLYTSINNVEDIFTFFWLGKC